MGLRSCSWRVLTSDACGNAHSCQPPTAPQCWNDSWVAAGEDDERWLYGLAGLTAGCYAGTLTLAGACCGYRDVLPFAVSQYCA